MPQTFTIPIHAQITVPDNVDLNDPAFLAQQNAKAQTLSTDVQALVQRHFANQQLLEAASPRNVTIVVDKIDKP